MAQLALRGVPAGPGRAAGRASVARAATPLAAHPPIPPAQRGAELDRAALALQRAAVELTTMADRLRANGRADEAEIVDTGALMAADPALEQAVNGAIQERGATAAAAIVAAADAHANLLAALDDPALAARAADVRSLGQRAAALAGGRAGRRDPRDAHLVLVADDLGPADLLDVGPEIRAIVLAQGNATTHAAILARSLGIPMVVGLGEGRRAIRDGELLHVDGTSGVVLVGPDAQDVAGQSGTSQLRATQFQPPAETRDRWPISVLANVATGREVAIALASGAEGVGLLRTELAFMAAQGWPDEAAHRQALAPVLAGLDGRPATVRLLDLGGDKAPPFLAGSHERGIRLLLASPDALRAQLRAVLDLGRRTRLRLLLPMVVDPDDVRAVRSLLIEAAAELRIGALPPLGAMVEVPAAVAMMDRLSPEADFFSIGTNDLSRLQLGLTDRAAPGAAPAHHPAVLALVAATVAAAHAAGRPVAVCGEAASDPIALPLLLGLQVRELSVGAARVAATCSWVRALDMSALAGMARRALAAGSAAEVAAIVQPVADLLLEAADTGGESRDGRGGVVPVRPETHGGTGSGA